MGHTPNSLLNMAVFVVGKPFGATHREVMRALSRAGACVQPAIDDFTQLVVTRHPARGTASLLEAAKRNIPIASELELRQMLDGTIHVREWITAWRRQRREAEKLLGTPSPQPNRPRPSSMQVHVLRSLASPSNDPYRPSF